MNYELFDFVEDLRHARSTEDSGQAFVKFAQRTGASVVHTFFGTEAEKISVSTLPTDYTQAEVSTASNRSEHVVQSIRAGEPRVFWGIELDLDNPNVNDADLCSSWRRYDLFRQRSSVTFSMPDADRGFSGAGVGIGFDETGETFRTRMAESGGAFAVAAYAAYSQMLALAPQNETESPLSQRQAQVLQGLAQGDSLAEIADRLGISLSAVNLYLANLRKKLGVRTKEEALAQAVLHKWIQL